MFFKKSSSKFEINGGYSEFAQNLGPIYHNFENLGVKTIQIEGIYPLNQTSKETVIMSYILHAIAKIKAEDISPISFAEFFCADGFFCMFAKKFGADFVKGFDNDKDGHFDTAIQIRDYLKLKDVDFEKTDINQIDSNRKFSIVANLGGLYHVSNPEEILKKSYKMSKNYLIVQNVVSLANNATDYFETPAPGWTWGSRFSRESFDIMIKNQGWNIIDQTFNILKGNERPEDKGSVYYLIKI